LSWYRAAGWQEIGEGDEEESLPPQPPRAGERWQLRVRLKRPHGHVNPGGFDYEGWLLERDIRATGYVRAPSRKPAASANPNEANRRLGESGALADRLQSWRETLREHLRAGPDDSPAAGVLAALAVGDQQAIDGDLWRTFARTGTTHLMSISGLHVTMFAALVGGLCGGLWRRWPWVCRRWPAQSVAAITGLLAAAFYTLLAGAAVPALRTLLMLAVCVLAGSLRRALSPWATLMLALVAVLLFDPWAIGAAGFWLSFVAVAALFLVGQARLEEVQGWRRFGLAQWAATLGTLPILLLFFQQFSLVSPLANLFAIPWVSGVTTPLAMLAALLPIPWLLSLATASMELLLSLLDVLASWPWAVWTPPAPSMMAVLLAALGIVVLLLPRGVPGKFPALVLLLPLLLTEAPRPSKGTAEITVLDVGQGLAVVVQTAEHVLLYDAGPYYSAESDAGERLIVPFLRSRGIARLDTLIVTHQDNDHAGGAQSVLESLPVGKLLSSLPARHPLHRQGVPSLPCTAPQRWQWDGVEFSLLYPLDDPQVLPQRGPYEKQGLKPNHVSCVLRVALPGHAPTEAVLLTSDIEAADERRLLDGGPPAALRAATVLVPHHGSRTSSSAAFIAAIGATHAILPVGYRNRFGHPKADVVEHWRQAGARLWRTDRQGAIVLTLAPGTAPTPLAVRVVQRRYWHDDATVTLAP
jgi:competence protein ComEC